MQFVDSLPMGLDDVWWQIAAPSGGIKASLEAVADGRELYLDLSIVRDDEYQALIRVLPDTILGVERDGSRESVYSIVKANAFFLDLDREMTENLIHLRVVINTQVTEPDLSAGYVVMWREGPDIIASAS